MDSYQLIPNTKYYYEVVAADSTGSLASTSQILITTTAPVLSQNSFAQATFVGIVDLTVGPTNVIAAIIDTTAGTTVYYPGQFVKIVANTNGGLPSVIGCTTKSDLVLGAIRFNVKDVSYASVLSAKLHCLVLPFGCTQREQSLKVLKFV